MLRDFSIIGSIQKAVKRSSSRSITSKRADGRCESAGEDDELASELLP